MAAEASLHSKGATATSDDVSLLYVVSRHGVRSPYGIKGGKMDIKDIRPYSSQPFPTKLEEWGVTGTAQLTKHGARVIEKMGAWWRKGEYPTFFDGGTGCKDFAAVYADVSQRDIDTADAFMRGFCDGNSEVPVWTAEAAQIFNQGETKVGREGECKTTTRDEVDSLVGGEGGNFSAFNDAHKLTVELVDTAVQCCVEPSLCGRGSGKRECTMTDLLTKYEGKYWEAFSGPATTGGYFANFMLLAYLNNMSNYSFGALTPEQVVRGYQLQLSTLEVVNNPWSARSYASTLAAHIAASLHQKGTGERAPGILHGIDRRLVYMAGHDINIILLRNLLGLQWLVEGWEVNNPPPGGMLSFELHEGNFVRVMFRAATPGQIRAATDFGPGEGSEQPSATYVAIPACRSDPLHCPSTSSHPSSFTVLIQHALESQSCRSGQK